MQAIKYDRLLQDRDKLCREIERIGGRKVRPEPKNSKRKPKAFRKLPNNIGASLIQLGHTAAARRFFPDMSDLGKPKPFRGIINMMKADIEKMDAAMDKQKVAERAARVAARRGRKKRV